ncbi:MAG: hypothetical protein NC180_05425 [Muribaculaceae bacterium]|nr:hypothetical protein [Roseburia sp.]MCM1430541.1 hypothetical protein [Muribaculaceae bacterium]MCM1492648.1 hypothetical protein [Muribaculaceae bacterium]
MEQGGYEIMHMDRRVAAIDASGKCRIYYKSFMPYNLYLEEHEERIDILVNNITNFYYWCSTRLLTLDRKYAKEILNSIGMVQAVTDKERAKIALTYRCASLTDVFWVRRCKEKVKFSDVNLYDNHLEDVFVDIALKGRQYSVENEALARDLSTNGCFPKAWLRRGNGFLLLKDGGNFAVEREILASRICRCFAVSQVLYEPDEFDGEKVSVSENITSKEYSIVSMENFEIYSINHGRDTRKYILQLDAYNYYMMNVIDYLVGNTDRHWGNWGVLVKNKTNKPVSLHRLMDFNQAFHSYDSIEGANCQTLFGRRKMTQKEAAVQAVKRIGLNQTEAVGRECFRELPQYYAMFEKRLDILKEALSFRIQS